MDAEEFFDQDNVDTTTAASDVVDGVVGSGGGPDVKSTSRTLSSSISNSASTSSARSGSLSEDHISRHQHQQPRMNVNKQLSSSATSHGSRDNILSGGGGSSTSGNSNLGGGGGGTVQSQPQQQSPMSQSMSTTILNLEENRVTIQVPGVQSSNVQPRTSQHPTVVKQSSAEKGIFP